MSERTLRQAVRALQTVKAEHHLAEETELRVLSTLRQRAKRGRNVRGAARLFSLSLCVAASAHAAVRGPAETWRAVAELWPSAVREETARPEPVRSARTPKAAETRAVPVPEQVANPAESAHEGPSAPLPRTPSARSRKVAARSVRPIRRPELALEPTPQVTSDPDALYGEAHQLHFVSGDKYAALRAWDAYLAAAPDGTFAPEAHYNRAVCLIALGRIEVALSALRSIAAGEAASYRARDATRLIRVLEQRAR